VVKGTDPKSVTIMFYGDAKYSAKDAMSMQALGEVLTIKLIEQLRENESGVYGVSARGIMNKIPNGSYSFNIGFLRTGQCREINCFCVERITKHH
jgi:zinc protease